MPAGLPWPIRYVVDEHGRDTGFMAVRGTLSAGGLEVLERLAASRRLVGFTHHGTFPYHHEAYRPFGPQAPDGDGRRRPYVQACEAWGHCFRRPDEYLPDGRPRILLTGSDFVDPERCWSVAHRDGTGPKRWDLCYSCLPNWFNEVQKNWPLAKACLETLAVDHGLRILCIGRADSAEAPRLPGVDYVDQLEWSAFLACLARSKVAWFPNVLDASPRVITEALSVDVPVLVNEQILGGWKYVNEATGAFFRDETDVADVAMELIGTSHSPRDWYVETGGPARAGARLAALLRSLGEGTGGDGGALPAFDGEFAEPADQLRD